MDIVIDFILGVSDLFVDIVPDDHPRQYIIAVFIDLVETVLKESQGDVIDGVFEVVPVVVVHKNGLIVVGSLVGEGGGGGGVQQDVLDVIGSIIFEKGYPCLMVS